MSFSIMNLVKKPVEDIATEVQLLESIFENALDAKLVIDSKSRLVKANKAAQELFGVNPHYYTPIYSHFPRATQLELKKYIELIADTKHIRTEISFKLETRVRYFDLSIASIMDQRYTLLIFRDITTAVLSRQSRDMFLSVAGHEMKTPLAVIQSYADLLMRRLALDSSTEAFFEKINQNVEILANYVNSIVDEIKIGTGKFEYNDAKEDLDQILVDIVTELQMVYKKRKITLKGTTKKSILIDRLRLKQVISNLVNNAYKYSPKGSPIVIQLKATLSTIQIEVTDQGQGISKKDQKSIFEAFYRTGKSYSNKSGLGLGLYIANQIVSHYGGTLTVKSVYRKGSTFSVKLPFDS